MSTPPPPPPPPYGQPSGPPPYRPGDAPYPNGTYAGYQPVQAVRTNGLAVAALVCGITGIILSCFFVLPILGIVFGAVARNQIKKQPHLLKGAGMALAGLILGICGVVLYAVLLAAVIGRR
jgi:hypothetical protein